MVVCKTTPRCPLICFKTFFLISFPTNTLCDPSTLTGLLFLHTSDAVLVFISHGLKNASISDLRGLLWSLPRQLWLHTYDCLWLPLIHTTVISDLWPSLTSPDSHHWILVWALLKSPWPCHYQIFLSSCAWLFPLALSVLHDLVCTSVSSWNHLLSHSYTCFPRSSWLPRV